MSDDSDFSPRGDESDFKPNGGGGDDDDDDDEGSGGKKKKKAAAKSKAKSKEKGAAKSKAKTKTASKKGGEEKTTNKRKAASGGEEKTAKHAKGEELSGEQAEGAVLGYMMKQNRPYSHLQVYDNLHQIVKKPVVQRILAEGAASGKLTVKEWKKNKVYWWNQDALASAPFGEDEQRNAEAEYKQNTDASQQINQYIRQLESQMSSASSLPNDAECDRDIAKLQVELKEKQERLKKLTTPAANGAPVTVSKEQIQKAHQIYMKHFLMWKKHKGGVMSVMQDIFDRTGGGKGSVSDEFLEEKGIDSDESVGVDWKKYQALASRKL